MMSGYKGVCPIEGLGMATILKQNNSRAAVKPFNYPKITFDYFTLCCGWSKYLDKLYFDRFSILFL